MFDPITPKELFDALSDRELEHFFEIFKAKNAAKYQLCYVKQETAYSNIFILYFVEDYKEARGDDWNDAPYEHNASEPYNDELATIVVKSYNYMSPCQEKYNSDYSVDDINKHQIPWLTTGEKKYDLLPGMTLEKCIELATESGADVYVLYNKKK